MDGWMDGWLDGWMDGWMARECIVCGVVVEVCVIDGGLTRTWR